MFRFYWKERRNSLSLHRVTAIPSVPPILGRDDTFKKRRHLLAAFYFFKLFNHAVEVVTEPSIVGGSCFFSPYHLFIPYITCVFRGFYLPLPLIKILLDQVPCTHSRGGKANDTPGRSAFSEQEERTARFV